MTGREPTDLMHYGIHLAASGALTSLYRQDVLANNLANIDTVGFKPEIVATQARATARDEDGLGTLPSNELLERLGGGMMSAPNRIDFGQAALNTTGNSLDLAIRGEGFFLVEERGTDGGSFLRLTRDGRFTLNDDGRLVMATTGLNVLDDAGRPIRLEDDAGIAIASDGLMTQNGEEIAKLAIVDVPDRTRLSKRGAGLLNAPADAIQSRSTASGLVVQGAVEASGVSDINTMLSVTSAGRAASGNLAVIGYHDRMMDQAVNRLGRITG